MKNSLTFLILLALTTGSVELKAGEFELGCGINSDGAYLSFTTQSGKVEIVDFQFEATGWYHGDLACTRWVQSLDREALEAFRESNFIMYETTDRKVGRLRPEVSSHVMTLCSQSKDCRLRFPTSLFYPSKGRPSVDPKCYAHDSADDVKVRIKQLTDLPRFERLDVSRYWKTPDDNFTKVFSAETNPLVGKSIIISTMGVSVNEVMKIRELAEVRGFVAYIIFDLEILMGEKQSDKLDQLLNAAGHHVHLIPAFKTAKYMMGKHHLKGVVILNNEPTAIFSSSNLTSQDAGLFSELGFVSRNRDFSMSMFSAMKSTIDEYCEKRLEVSCLLDQYQTIRTGLRYELEAALAGSCAAFVQDRNVDSATRVSKGGIKSINSSAFDSEDVALSLIRSAKSSILFFTHQIGSERVMDALIAAKSRGVQVTFGLGSFELLKPSVLERVRLLKGFDAKHGTSTNHSKFLVIDKTSALWGTGNFTSTSFKNSREFSFYTSDLSVIAELSKFSDLLLEGQKPK